MLPWLGVHAVANIALWGVFWNPTGWSFVGALLYTGLDTEYVFIFGGIFFAIFAYYYAESVMINLMDGDHFIARVVLLSMIYWAFVLSMSAYGFFSVSTYEAVVWWLIIWGCIVSALSKALQQQGD